MKSLCGKTKLPFDVHLMIEGPDRYLEDFVTDTTEFITVHQEACPHLNRTVAHIKSLGVKAGVALNPATPVNTLECILDEVDLVLVMSVNPGFGGQAFIESALEKARILEQLRAYRQSPFEIEIDGGITPENVGSAVRAGVSLVVAGSSVFGTADIESRVRLFLEKF